MVSVYVYAWPSDGWLPSQQSEGIFPTQGKGGELQPRVICDPSHLGLMCWVIPSELPPCAAP